jgi:hypothetical protein
MEVVLETMAAVPVEGTDARDGGERTEGIEGTGATGVSGGTGGTGGTGTEMVTDVTDTLSVSASAAATSTAAAAATGTNTGAGTDTGTGTDTVAGTDTGGTDTNTANANTSTVQYEEDALKPFVKWPRVEKRRFVQSFCEITSPANQNGKTNNLQFSCRYCHKRFMGQILTAMIHLTGVRRGGQRMSPCANPPEDLKNKAMSLFQLEV